MEFTPLERDVLDWIASKAGDPALTEQLKSVEAVSREYTGVGSFTDLKVPTDAPRVSYRVAPIDPNIESPAMLLGAGAVLFFEDGHASKLELYTFEPIGFPQNLVEWKLS